MFRAKFGVIRISIGILIASLLLAGCAISEKQIKQAPVQLEKTNLDQVDIAPYVEEGSTESYIQYADGSHESIDESFIGLFINGSIIKHAKVTKVGEQLYTPLSKLSGPLELQTLWEKDKNQAIIQGVGIKATLTTGHLNVQSGKKEVILEAAPIIIDNDLYVPITFVDTLLQGSTSYFDGTNSSEPHIVDQLPHVMISYYPKPVSQISKEEAVEGARNELIKAYENKFGAYSPYKEDNKPDIFDDKENLRFLITNLAVQDENDRFYVLPFMYDFWVDKYTGDLYTYYNGIAKSIREFDAADENALAFPG